MKKTKLSIGLVTSFVAAMALSACGSSVTKKDGTVVSFKGYGDEELSVLTDEIYNDYMTSSTGISKCYDQVMEVLIRNAFQNDPKAEKEDGLKGIKKNYNQIESEAKDNVKGAKQTAKQNASTNGTSYKTEWQNTLKEKGVKDEEELLQYFIYQLEKEQIEDWYYEKNKDSLKAEYLGVTNTGEKVETKASSRFPYHVRHILVKVEDGGSNYATGTISKDQAKLLSNTVELLAQGVMTFGEVAQKKSEDSSNSSYGDVGIMTNAISGGKLGMVNEFQLGIYAYDAIIENKDVSEVVDEGLGLDKTVNGVSVKEYFTNRGIAEVPYSVFKELGDVAELESNAVTGLPVEDNKSAIYPRNLLWNKYLNNHSIFVITNGKRLNDDTVDPTELASYFEEADDYVAYNKQATEIDYTKLPRFLTNEHFDGINQKVLSDENGNVIIGVRSTYGIHLMIVQRSAYSFADEKVSLDEYYTTAIPGDEDYPKDDKDNDKVTYVNFITSVNKSEYNTRAETVKSAIKGFDSTYDYRLYEHLSSYGDEEVRNAKFEGEKTLTLLSSIDDYIGLQREKNNIDQDEGLQEVWKTYIELLAAQDWVRQDTDRVLSEGCKIGFTKDNLTDEEKAMYEEGGKCYVK